MGLPSSHSTILVSFSFFWLQMSLSKPFREVVSRKKMVGVSHIYVSFLEKSGRDLCARVERGASQGGGLRDVTLSFMYP